MPAPRSSEHAPGAKHTPNLATATRYLRLLYGDQAPGYLNLCFFNGNPVEWYPARNLDQIARRAVQLATSPNVYHGIGPRSDTFFTKLSEDERGKVRGSSTDVIALPGVWLDVDFLHPVHKKTNLPPTANAALKLVAEFPLKPTLIIHSGHGLQVWFLFHELLLLEDEQDRTGA